MNNKQVISNRRATYDYQLGNKIVAGISLSPNEVRRLREGRVSLKNAFVDIKDSQAWLQKLEIFQLPNERAGGHRLLLTKSQIKTLQASLDKHNTVVPLRLILGNRYIKIEIAAASGKKKHDKRETIKARETRRSIERTLKRQSPNK